MSAPPAPAPQAPEDFRERRRVVRAIPRAEVVESSDDAAWALWHETVSGGL